MQLTKSSSIAVGCFVVSFFTAASVWGQGPGLFPFQLRSSGGYLGINLTDIDSDRARDLKMPEPTGVEIMSVVEGTPAYQAGLRPNDVVLSFNGEKVLGVSQLARLVAETPPNRRVNLVCWRKGEEKKIVVTTGTSPAPAPGDIAIFSAYRVADVPSTMLLWRDVIIGIESESLSEQLAQTFGVKQGVLIWSVASGSPAQHAGLRAGDVLTDLCGRPVHSPRDVGVALQQLQTAQKPVSLNVMREHKPLSLSLALTAGER